MSFAQNTIFSIFSATHIARKMEEKKIKKRRSRFSKRTKVKLPIEAKGRSERLLFRGEERMGSSDVPLK
jgi:hypothetical protein